LFQLGDGGGYYRPVIGKHQFTSPVNLSIYIYIYIYIYARRIVFIMLKMCV